MKTVFNLFLILFGISFFTFVGYNICKSPTKRRQEIDKKYSPSQVDSIMKQQDDDMLNLLINMG